MEQEKKAALPQSWRIACRLVAVVCVLLACVSGSGVAFALGGDGEAVRETPVDTPGDNDEEEKPLESGVDIPAQPGEFYLPLRAEGEIVRVSPRGVRLTHTDARLGYVTTISARKAVTWLTRRKIIRPDGTEKTVQQVEVYAEGDVIIVQKDTLTGVENKAYCRKLYFDFLNRKGVMLDGWVKFYETRGEQYLYITAEEIRQLATDEANTTRLRLLGARFTNDEYGRPMLHMDARTIDIEQKRKQVPRYTRGKTVLNFVAKNVFAKVRDIPFFYLPFVSASSKNRYFLQSFRTGHSSKYGTFVLTKWDLNKLGLLDNDWSKLSLRLDEYSERGLGVGFDFEYARKDYRGFIEGYFIHDSGKDRVGDWRLKPEDRNRGRIHAVHMQDLGNGWKANLEISKLSDRGFLSEFYEDDFDEGVDQDTQMFIWRRSGHTKLSLMGRVEINDFITTTEYLPRLRASALAWPMLNDFVYVSFDSQIANMRRDYDKAFPFSDDRMVRGDINTEFTTPFSLGIFRFKPFLGLRGTFYDATWSEGGGVGRFSGYSGMKVATQFSRVYENVLGQKRLRHVLRPYVQLYDVFENTRNPMRLIQADSVDLEDKRSVWTLGVRQVFQTKRGEPGRERSFDALTIDLQLNFFTDDDDPLAFFVNPPGLRNTAFKRGLRFTDNFKGDIEWNLYDNLTVFGGWEYNLDTDRVDVYDCGFHLRPSARSYLKIRNYFVRNDGTSNYSSFMNIFPAEIDRDNTFFPYGPITDFRKRNVLQVNFGWETGEKWAFAIESEYDFENSRSLEHSFIVRRYFHHWVMDVGVKYDHDDRDTTISVSFSPREVARSFVKTQR